MRKKEAWMFKGAAVTVFGRYGTITKFDENTIDGTDYVYYIWVRLGVEKHSSPYHPNDVAQIPTSNFNEAVSEKQKWSDLNEVDKATVLRSSALTFESDDLDKFKALYDKENPAFVMLNDRSDCRLAPESIGFLGLINSIFIQPKR
jgi:hypothetical protein